MLPTFFILGFNVATASQDCRQLPEFGEIAGPVTFFSMSIKSLSNLMLSFYKYRATQSM